MIRPVPPIDRYVALREWRKVRSRMLERKAFRRFGDVKFHYLDEECDETVQHCVSRMRRYERYMVATWHRWMPYGYQADPTD